MFSNSLILEGWKVKVLRPTLESLTHSGSLFTFLVQNQPLSSNFFHINCLKSLSPSGPQADFQAFYAFSKKHCSNHCYFRTWIAKCGKIRLWNLRKSVLAPWIPEYFEQLENWLERLNILWSSLTYTVFLCVSICCGLILHEWQNLVMFGILHVRMVYIGISNSKETEIVILTGFIIQWRTLGQNITQNVIVHDNSRYAWR